MKVKDFIAELNKVGEDTEVVCYVNFKESNELRECYLDFVEARIANNCIYHANSGGGIVTSVVLIK